MFAVIYRGYVKEGLEDKYQKAWNTVARYFVEKRGAIGSCLHRTPDGMWVAYSRWPNQETRDASWPTGKEDPSKLLPDEIRIAILAIKDCLDEERKLPDICMEGIDEISLPPR